MTGLECGHRFCTQCWGEYLTTKIMEEGLGQSISCAAHGCDILVDDVSVMRLISDPRVKLKYQHLITNSFVEVSFFYLLFCFFSLILQFFFCSFSVIDFYVGVHQLIVQMLLKYNMLKPVKLNANAIIYFVLNVVRIGMIQLNVVY